MAALMVERKAPDRGAEPEVGVVERNGGVFVPDEEFGYWEAERRERTDRPGRKGTGRVENGGARDDQRSTLRVLDVERMLREEPAPIPWLAEPLLATGCLTLLAGREGQGKSMLALALAAAVGRGEKLAGLDCLPASTLYVDAENGEREAHRRVRGLGVRPQRLVYVEADGFSLRKHLGELRALVAERRPGLLVLDSLRSLAPGLDENDSAKVEEVLRPLATLAQRGGIAVLLLHHAGKQGTDSYRGSTAIGAAVELGFTLSRHPEDPQGATRRRLGCWKSRPAPEPPPRWITLEATGSGILLGETEAFSAGTAKREGVKDELLAALGDEPASWADWVRAAGLDPKDGTARRARDDLEKTGAATKDDADRWARTSRSEGVPNGGATAPPVTPPVTPPETTISSGIPARVPNMAPLGTPAVGTPARLLDADALIARLEAELGAVEITRGDAYHGPGRSRCKDCGALLIADRDTGQPCCWTCERSAT